jgi:hypothetical protein
MVLQSPWAGFIRYDNRGALDVPVRRLKGDFLRVCELPFFGVSFTQGESLPGRLSFRRPAIQQVLMRVTTPEKRLQNDIAFWEIVLVRGLQPLPVIDLSTAESAKRAVTVLNRHRIELERVGAVLNALKSAPPSRRLFVQ